MNLVESYELKITGDYRIVYNHYPTNEEIVSFIMAYYPDGVGYYAVGGTGRITAEMMRQYAYNIEAKVSKIFTLK